MIEPKIIQIKDYSDIIGKEFILLEDTKKFPCNLFKGTKFLIKKIKNNDVTIKVIGTDEELKPAVQLDFKRWIKNEEEEIAVLQKVVDMWNESPEQYIIDEEYFLNDFDNSGKGFPINTSYPIPDNEPNKAGKDNYDTSIYTFNYIRKDDVNNIYSYQKQENTWYSKETYEYIILGNKKMIKELENCENPWFKLNLKSVKNQVLTIAKLNSAKFELVK